MADKPVRRITSIKKPAPPAPPAAAAAPPAGYDPALGYDPAALAALPINNATGSGFLPPGTVLTDFEQEGLKLLGHDPSKAIPTDLASKIAAAQQQLQGPVPLPVPMDTPPTVIPKAVDIRTLPPEKRAELAESLRTFQQVMSEQQAPDPSPRRATVPPPPPQVATEQTVVDDLRPGMTHAEAMRAAPPTPGPGQAAQAIQQEAHDRAAAARAQGQAEGRAQAQAEAPPPPYAPQPGDAGGTLHPVACPHCGWDLKKDDPTEPTENDKLDFVQAVLGQQRFKKTYALLGGKLRVTFRSLKTQESNMAFRQVVVDAQTDLKNRLINDTPFYWRNLTTYRTILALESVDSDLTGTIEIPPIDEIEVEKDSYAFPDTKLMAVHDMIVEQAMPTEHLQQIVGHCFNEFQALCDKLTVMAEDPGFYKAIG